MRAAALSEKAIAYLNFKTDVSGMTTNVYIN
jgi:hypothetical protein